MLDFSFPVDYPDQQALTDYLTQTREGFINVSEMPDSRDEPYVLDAKGTAYRSETPPRGTQSVVFEVYQNVGGRARRPGTRHSTTTCPSARPSPSTPCSNRAPSRWMSSFRSYRPNYRSRAD